MRQLSILVAVAILTAACSLIDLGTTSESTDVTGTQASNGTVSPETPDTRAVSAPDCADTSPDIVLLCQAIDLVQRNYVDDVSDQVLMDAGLEGIAGLPEGGETGDLACPASDPVAGPICDSIDATDADPIRGVEAALTAIAGDLDPNSAYLDPEALQLAQDDTSGRVEGIGALVNAEDATVSDPVEAQCSTITDTCRLVIVSTFEGSPAQRAGVLPGDAIVSVDGRDIEGYHIDEVTELVRGPAGTEVRVGFDRDGGIVEFDIVREAIDIPVAEWEMVGDVGYLRLNLFTVTAGDQVHAAVRELLDQGATALVLDLRDNPGGALQASIEVTSEFLADGIVVITESPEDTRTYEVTGDGLATDPDLPLWVVVNQGSASASEVTAGVLGESGRATIVGQNTFGKNTVQQRFPLGNGGAMKLTIARWTTPSGTDFGAVGITPGIEADFDPFLEPDEVVARVRELTGTSG